MKLNKYHQRRINHKMPERQRIDNPTMKISFHRVPRDLLLLIFLQICLMHPKSLHWWMMIPSSWIYLGILLCSPLWEWKSPIWNNWNQPRMHPSSKSLHTAIEKIRLISLPTLLKNSLLMSEAAVWLPNSIWASSQVWKPSKSRETAWFPIQNKEEISA